jgi:hypothetical protein
VADTLKMIAEAQKGMEGFDSEKLDEVGETMMEDMMQQFEGFEEKDDYNEVRLQQTVSSICVTLYRFHSLLSSYDNVFSTLIFLKMRMFSCAKMNERLEII